MPISPLHNIFKDVVVFQAKNIKTINFIRYVDLPWDVNIMLALNKIMNIKDFLNDLHQFF